MRITIIGSSGLLGRRLTEQLECAGHKIHAVSSNSPQGIDRGSGLLPPDFELPSGTQAIVYLAQSPHYRRMPELAWHVWNVNVVSAVRAAEIARRAGVRKFLYTSTGSVYAPSFAPLTERAPFRRDRWYPLSKLQAEEALSMFRGELQVTIARPFGIYGPGQTGMLAPNLAQAIEQGLEVTIDRNPLDSRDRDGLKISLCYVDDAALAVAKLLEIDEPPEVVNLAGPRPVAIRELAETLAAALGKPARFKELDRLRETDLIADTRLFESTVQPTFTDLPTGIGRMIDALQPTWARAA